MVHQRIEFALLAIDQIVNQAANWHYMFGGQDSMPLVVRMLIGRGWGQGPQHAPCPCRRGGLAERAAVEHHERVRPEHQTAPQQSSDSARFLPGETQSLLFRCLAGSPVLVEACWDGVEADARARKQFPAARRGGGEHQPHGVRGLSSLRANRIMSRFAGMVRDRIGLFSCGMRRECDLLKERE